MTTAAPKAAPPQFNGVRLIEDTASALAHLVPHYMPSVQAQFDAFQKAVLATQPPVKK